MPAPARRIATRVLHRVVHDDAWAAPSLDAELRRARPSRADAALATQIVYGTLRVVPDLDAALGRHARRPVRVDDWSRAALLGAAFQLLHLGRVPSHAVVDDTVAIIAEKRGRRLGGFANAILRRVASERPAEPALPTALAVPRWLRSALDESVGASHAQRLLAIGTEAPSIDLRVRDDVDRDEVMEAIARAHPHAVVEPAGLSSRGIRASMVGDPRRLPGYEEGSFAVQEEGAQLIGSLLHAQRGDRVLDVCAGRGGKTAQLVEAVGPTGFVVATDLHAHRVEQIAPELARLRLPVDRVSAECVDWTRGPGTVSGLFDRVLIDAPCTGLGTLRRRPEMLLRAAPDDAAHMGETQRRILENAARCVRPGGLLLYAVCSPLRAEGLEVVEAVALPGFEAVRDRDAGPGSLRFGPDGRLLLGPWETGAGPWADAYQIHVWVNVG